MFAAGSIKSSKWGWDVKVYPSKYGNTPTYNGSLLTSNVGYFTGGCLAPNGLIYCLPTYIGAQYVTVIKPGKSNSKTGKWEPATIVNVPATGTAKNAYLPDQTSAAAALQRRFGGKGILAPNGLIYFFGFNGQGYVVVKPQENLNLDIAQFTEWKVVTYASVGLEPVTGRSGYYSGFLHTDGKIYLLPNSYGFTGTSSPVARIVPRDSYESTDIIQKSAFWTPTTATNTPYKYFPTSASFSSVNNFPKPGDIDGVQITVPPNTYVPNYDSTSGGIGSMPPIGDAISHPNGNIYVFGGGRNAYILKLKTDDTTWNSSTTTVGRPLFYTTNDLRVPNNINPNTHTGAGIQGSFMSGSIEKLRPGQDPTTAKIYLHYAGTWENDASLPVIGGYFQNAYTRTVVFDPVTETFENVGDQVTTITTDQQPFNLKPGIRMANGHIFSISNPLPTDKNRYGQLIISGDTLIDENKMIGPTTRRSILSDIDVSTINNSCYSGIDPVCNQGSHALTGSALGKTFVTAPWGCFEITSVKGFYPGIRYFNYNDNLNSSFTSAKNTINDVMYLSSNQIILLGVNLTGVLSSGKPFYLESPSSEITAAFTISSAIFTFEGYLISVLGTPFYPNYQTYVQGVNFISDTELVVSVTYEEFLSGIQWVYKNISIEGLNSGIFTTSGYNYVSDTETLTLIFPTGTFDNIGNDTNALLYYADPAVDTGSTFTYGQLVEFPNEQTLRIWGVDLTNSMYDVSYINIQGSIISSNNGTKDITTSTITYDNSGYTNITFSTNTFTTSDIETDVTISFQYALNDGDIYDIPSDLNTLPTSLYNSYHNKPR